MKKEVKVFLYVIDRYGREIVRGYETLEQAQDALLAGFFDGVKAARIQTIK